MSAFKECRKCGIYGEIAMKFGSVLSYSPKHIPARKPGGGITDGFQSKSQAGNALAVTEN